jgi:hypothetical protein
VEHGTPDSKRGMVGGFLADSWMSSYLKGALVFVKPQDGRQLPRASLRQHTVICLPDRIRDLGRVHEWGSHVTSKRGFDSTWTLLAEG